MAKKKEEIKDDVNAQDKTCAEEYGDILSGPLSPLEGEAALDVPYPRPIPWPIFLGVSGLYQWNWRYLPIVPQPSVPLPVTPTPTPTAAPCEEELEGADSFGIEEASMSDVEGAAFSILPWYFRREELRLDVDGRYPQMTVSGTIYSGLTVRVHWIASLKRIGRYKYSGNIWYKHGTTSILPYTNVQITATPSLFSGQRKVTAVFSGGGGSSRTLTYRFTSRYFHPIEFEFDNAAGAPRVTSVQTVAHPNRPAGMTSETLTIENVYRRAGFDVSKSGGDGTIPMGPLDPVGPDALWSDMEMHDAMQIYWSKFANKPQWSMWVLFASLHVSGTGLGGIMFDDIGPNHRQGTAIFGDAFIANAPPGDAAPAAWVRRMRFWTAVHEMGHVFNLAHSWQKALGVPWIPLSNEPEARSFMNYPYRVSGGQVAFFANFWYRFSNSELLFMRHAPSEFVQPGNADWFDHHGFEQAAVSAEPTYKLEIRVNRESPRFEFLEPVVLELKLTNISSGPQVFDSQILSSGQDVTVIVKKDGKPASQWVPFAKHCSAPSPKVLEPGKSDYHSLPVSAGLNGWDISEPGVYTLQVAVRKGEEDIVSNPLKIFVSPPRGYDDELVAQDFFSEDVGRVLAFHGSRYLETANEALHEVVKRLPESKAAYHARVALGNPLARRYKLLVDKKKGFDLCKKDAKAAQKNLGSALSNVSEAAETLGHIDYKKAVDGYCEFLSGEGQDAAAAKCQGAMHKGLSARNVLTDVLKEITDTEKKYKSKS